MADKAANAAQGVSCPLPNMTPYQMEDLARRVADNLAAMHLSNGDAVSWAAQLGRLDLVSLLLTALGLLAIFGGLFAFGYLRGQAMAIAKRTAEEEVERRLTELLRGVSENSVHGLGDGGDKKDGSIAANVEQASAEAEYIDGDDDDGTEQR